MEDGYLQLVWCNLAGQRCSRCLPGFTGGESAPRDVPSLCTACIALPIYADVPAPGSGIDGMGSVRLAWDLPSRQIPWGPLNNQHLAMVTMVNDFTREPWSLCPRSLLRRVLAHAEARAGLRFRAGFEIEFVLTDRQGHPLATAQQTYCSASAFDASMPVLQDMCAAIHALGLRVEQLHKESAPGQFEIVLGHLPALEAADGLLLAKQAIVATAHRHGLRASFLPKLAAGHAGSGCHMHLSLWSLDGQNRSTCGLVLGNAKSVAEMLQGVGHELLLGPTFRPFLAGVHAHLPSVMCFTAPTPNSFRRLQPGAWAGCFACWGFANKEAPICIPLVSPGKGLFTNFELKLFDGTANPHVALAAVISAGLVGIDQKLELPPPTQSDPGLSGAAPRLPQTFAEAKSHLMAAERAPFRALLGEELVQAHVAVREAEWAKLGPLSIEEEVKLLLDRY